MVTAFIASFKGINELQRERLHESRATTFSWNGESCGQFLEAKSWVIWSLSHLRLCRAWLVEGIFYTGQAGMLCRSYCDGTDFMEISKFLDILRNWACTNSVYQALFFSRTMYVSLETRLYHIDKINTIMSKVTAPQDAHNQLVLQVFLGSNTLEFSGT